MEHPWRLMVWLIMCVVATGCNSRPKLPADPGLLNEELGLGIRLEMSADEAQEVAGRWSNQCEVVVLSREESNQRAPYDSQDNPRDRVLAVYNEPTEDIPPAGEAAVQTGVIRDIRCYLADPANSIVKLGGTNAALLTEEDAMARYGQPAQRTEDGSNEVHLLYYFHLESEPDQMLELVLSFHAGGKCFALSIAKQMHLN